MKLVSRVMLVVASIVLLTTASALAAAWQPLGKCIVDYRTNPKTIAAASGAGAFAKIRLEVQQNNLVIENVKVTFADGQTFDRELNKYLGGGHGVDIDLPAAKEIQKVEFSYSKASATNSRLALVLLQGSN